MPPPDRASPRPRSRRADPASQLAPYYSANTFPVQLVLRTSNMTLVYQHASVADAGFQAAIDSVLAAP